MTAEDRRRTALHEAGHAVAGVVMGRPLEYASIRPGRTFSGIAVPVPRDRPPGFDPDRFVPVQPAELRADVERQIVTVLAGDLAALYLAEPRSGYVDTSEEEVAAALEALGPRVAELVIHHETDEVPTDSDEERARGLALAFIGNDAGAAHYLAWLRAEASQLVIRYRAAIVRVADALERHAVLAGDAIAALVYPPKGA